MMIQKKKFNSKIVMLKELNNHLMRLIIMINKLTVDPIWLRSYFIKIIDHMEKVMNLKVVFSRWMIIVEEVLREFRNLFRKFWMISRSNLINL